MVQSARQEAAPAISAAVLHLQEADTHRQLAGRFDLQLLGRDRLAICWAAHEEPACVAAEYARRGEKCPLAVSLGGDPAVLMAATARLAPAADPLALAGLLSEKPLDAVACRTVHLVVPAEADVVVEGYLDPAEPPVTAGPLVTPLGRMASPGPSP